MTATTAYEISLQTTKTINRFDIEMTNSCKVMHVGPRNPGHVYRMAGKDLEVAEEEKDIGVTVTNDLRPTQQCRRAARTAR